MHRRVFLSASGAGTIAGLTSLAGVPAQAVAPSSGASRLMAKALVADGPPPDYAEQMQLYGQFVGAWTAHVTELFQGGQTYIADWNFGWILHRRGVQDVIRVHLARADPGGTTVRGLRPGRRSLACELVRSVERAVLPLQRRRRGRRDRADERV
jgi:hypothetical protein